MMVWNALIRLLTAKALMNDLLSCPKIDAIILDNCFVCNIVSAACAKMHNTIMTAFRYPDFVSPIRRSRSSCCRAEPLPQRAPAAPGGDVGLDGPDGDDTVLWCENWASLVDSRLSSCSVYPGTGSTRVSATGSLAVCCRARRTLSGESKSCSQKRVSSSNSVRRSYAWGGGGCTGHCTQKNP